MRKAIKGGERVVRERFGVDPDTCTGDHSCIRLSGCPSLTVKENPDPLRTDPVAHVDNSCVGCGVCGEVAHAAVLCPSFYRAELVYNPSRLGSLLGRVQGRGDRCFAAAQRAQAPALRPLGLNFDMAERPIKLTIAALGGQGGGVLADWLIEIAEAEGYIAQSTSVPGVAQRTGATIYYLEFFPRAAAERAGREPIMALMPVSGDVDCVLASELAEAGRAIQRGLVTPDRTTLIASTHRSFAIGEKSAMGQGAVDTEQLVDLVRSQAKRLVLFDMEETAERNQSVISSVLLGALCGSGVLPFRKQTFEDAIKKSGIAVKANLAAFEDACQRSQRGDSGFTGKTALKLPQEVPAQARTPALQPLLDRVRRLPAAAQPMVLEGARRAIDYQDPAYAALFLDRVERIALLEAPIGRCRLLFIARSDCAQPGAVDDFRGHDSCRRPQDAGRRASCG